MSRIVQWNPFHELEEMHRRLSTVIDNESQNRGNRNGNQSMAAPDWAPVVDISEDDTSFSIRAELPEVKKEDVHVTIQNRVLTLTGERKLPKQESGRKYHRTERSYGMFTRSFELPDNIDAAKVSANYKDGLLTVTVAKSEQALPKQIDVKVA